jgi:3'-phosphoadenosine 5'-phosphosulfate sulfotransferase (PAPS reductase)/FAD synthetase
MVLLFGAKSQPIFSDTGAEHPEMYARLDYLEERFREIHNKPDFKIIRVRAENAENTGTDNLTDYILHRAYFPSPMARFCTRLFKIEPMNRFLKNAGDCELMIGLNADEKDRTGNHGLLQNVKYSYPLIDLGINRATALAALKQYGLEPKLPVYMRRGGCIYCPFKSKKEYVAMAHLAPSQLEKVADLEEAVQRKSNTGKWYGVRDGIQSMRGLIEQEKTQSLFSAEEMYAQQPEEIGSPCGVFCHR